jgi:hypothetical protein
MIARALLALVLTAPAAALAQSPQVCPWLNAGTAAKILGSEVTATIHSDSNWSGSCRYVASGDPAAGIEITVGKTDTHPCGSGATPLTGIGNHAVLCSSNNTTDHNIQTVSGQVRDAWFVLVLATSPDKSPATPLQNKTPDQSPIVLLAEQVAGNLY